MIHIPLTFAALIIAIKAYLAAHGTAIATHIIVAAIKAFFLGKNVKMAALAAGASNAAADLLANFFNQ